MVKDNKMKRRKIRKGCLARLVIVAIMTIVGIIMCVKSCTGNKDDKIDSEPLETIKNKDEIDEHFALWPVPQEIRDANRGSEFPQNPGYGE